MWDLCYCPFKSLSEILADNKGSRFFHSVVSLHSAVCLTESVYINIQHSVAYFCKALCPIPLKNSDLLMDTSYRELLGLEKAKEF